MRVDAKRGHSGGYSATLVMHAEVVKSKFRSGPGKGRGGLSAKMGPYLINPDHARSSQFFQR